jgi:hypothetical protein
MDLPACCEDALATDYGRLGPDRVEGRLAACTEYQIPCGGGSSTRPLKTNPRPDAKQVVFAAAVVVIFFPTVMPQPGSFAELWREPRSGASQGSGRDELRTVS